MSKNIVCGAARALLLSLAVLISSAPSTLSAPIFQAPPLVQAQALIPNLSVVAPNLYRGGQPGLTALQQLQQAGVKVDVCLDFEKRYVAAEEQQAKALGMKFVNIPLNPFHHPKEEAISQFLSLVAHKDDEPVFVHCVHGQDRTGTMVAIFRLVHDNWSPDQAYQEMLDHGFHPFFTALSDTVYGIGRRMGMNGHKPTIGFITTHFGGHSNPERQI